MTKHLELFKLSTPQAQEFAKGTAGQAWPAKVTLDLDDGVKVNYGKFGDLLEGVKLVTGGAGDELVALTDVDTACVVVDLKWTWQ